jgi:AbiV family abortive infection protein
MNLRGQSSGTAAIAANARRLLQDAELLAQARRHPTAMALAILAIEEVGKYFLVRWSSEPRRKWRGRKSHQEKQSVVATFNLAKAAIREVEAAAEHAGFSRTEAGARDLLGMLTQMRHIAEYRSWALAEEERLVELVAGAMAEADAGTLSSRKSRLGLIDAAKQQCLYVDLDVTGAVASSPEQITEADTQAWLQHARDAVGHLPA